MRLGGYFSVETTAELEPLCTDLDRHIAAHLKDLHWDYDHFMLKWDEVLIGNGVLDYETYLTELAKLPVDTRLRTSTPRT